MTLISGKLLAAIATTLVACLAVIATYTGKVEVSVAPADTVFGAAGQTFSEEVFLQGNVTIGGRVVASSTAATATLASSDIKGVRLFNSKAASAATLTLPSRATLSSAGFLPNAGDTAEWSIHASTSPVTLVGATGVRLAAVGTTSLVVNTLHTGTIKFIRLPAIEGGTIEAHLFQDAMAQ